MNNTDIIIRPLLSEKVSKLAEASNKQYAFQVSQNLINFKLNLL